MLLHNKKVAVIGGGPVGLTMARLLQQQNVAVTVYERDKDAQSRIWGGTLDLHKTSGQLAMQQAGLLQRYYDVALPMGIKIVDHCGRLISTREITEDNKNDNPEINRNDLRTMLLDSLEDGTVIWDHKFTNVKAKNGIWEISFDGQPSAFADIVIGANGGMSKAREFVTDAKPEDTASFIVQGDVPDPEETCPALFKMCGGKRMMASYQGNLLVINPFNNGSLSYGVIFKTPDEWAAGIPVDFTDNVSVYNFLKERFADWDYVFVDLFKLTSAFVGLPTRRLPLDVPWKTSRPLPITLIGDAAHLMPPFAGQGVNTGLLDALIFSENLTGNNFETIEAAIADYERQMFVYATQAQADSHENELEMRDPDFSFHKLFKDSFA